MDTVSGIFRSAIWNETIPDHLRGRLAGVEMISWSSGPLLGDAEAGFLAALAGVRASVVSGGLACVAGSVALAVALPRFWGYDSRAHGAGGRRRHGERHRCAGVRNGHPETSLYRNGRSRVYSESTMPSHQYMYPKVTPVVATPQVARPATPPASGAPRAGRARRRPRRPSPAAR
jgi:MFS family permease